MPNILRCALDRETVTAVADERDRGTYTVRYLVDTEGFMSPRLVAVGALSQGPHPLPSLWSSYSYLGDTDAHSFARDYQVSLKEVRLESVAGVATTSPRYTIDVTYRPLDPGDRAPDPLDPTSPSIAQVNPLLRPPVVSWESELRTRFTEQAQDGRQIVNHAKQRFDEPVEVEDSRGVLVIQWNVASLKHVIEHNRTFELSVNSSRWKPFGNADNFEIPERAALIQSVQGQLQQHELGQTYFTEVYRIVLKGQNEVEPTWDAYIAEQGHQYLKKNAQNEIIKNADESNALFPKPGDPDFGREQPFRLNDDGTKRNDDDPGLFSQWEVRRKVDFNNLPFMPLFLT